MKLFYEDGSTSELLGKRGHGNEKEDSIDINDIEVLKSIGSTQSGFLYKIQFNFENEKK